MFQLIKETEEYAYYFNRLMGVGRFVRFSDMEVSLMDTGQEALEMLDILEWCTNPQFNILGLARSYD